MNKDDIGVRLYAAALDAPLEAILENHARFRTYACLPIPMVSRLATAAETIIAERVREARRECYNAVCAEFVEKTLDRTVYYNHGVTACRNAIAKLIEGETHAT